MGDTVQRARDALESGAVLLSQPTPAGPITPYKRALREANEALAALVALPVLRTCGDCGWRRGDGRGAYCGNDKAQPTTGHAWVFLDEQPPAWCPLRG